jgi:hypothetical protein
MYYIVRTNSQSRQSSVRSATTNGVHTQRVSFDVASSADSLERSPGPSPGQISLPLELDYAGNVRSLRTTQQAASCMQQYADTTIDSNARGKWLKVDKPDGWP